MGQKCEQRGRFVMQYSSCFRVRLPCRWTDDLLWDAVLGAIPPDVSLLWELDLGLDAPYFPLDDSMRFHALQLALRQFTHEIWPFYGQRSKGVVLYRGTADFSLFFSWSRTQEENWTVWVQKAPPAPASHRKKLFCADAFAYYFQMLSHALPDEAPLLLHFETCGCAGIAEAFQLTAKERFEHFSLILTPPREEKAPSAVCFPLQERCSDLVLQKLNTLFSQIKKPFRIIEELFLTESWEEVDTIYVLSDTVTIQGMRKLMGFCSAGGLVVVEGEPLGLSNEISWKEIGAEGFEPPAYWSQTSRASQAALCPDD